MYNNQFEISVVIPVYNSSATLSTLVFKIEQVMKSLHLKYEVILVDDASTDNSWEIINTLCNETKRIKAILLAMNNGQWVAALAGMSIASGQYIVTIDDDLEYDPKDIAKLYERIKKKPFKVVFGIAKEKYPKQGKVKLFALWRNKMINFIWCKPVTDSFKILTRDVVFNGDTFLPDRLFEAFINHRLPYNFWGYCDVSFSKRIYGESNHSFIKKAQLFCEFSVHFFRFSLKTFLSITTFALISFFSIIAFKGTASFIPYASIFAGVCLLVIIVLQYLKGRKLFHFSIAKEINTV